MLKKLISYYIFLKFFHYRSLLSFEQEKMSAKNITVLTPNGHRPVIKVSSHSTILEVRKDRF